MSSVVVLWIAVAMLIVAVSMALFAWWKERKRSESLAEMASKLGKAHAAAVKSHADGELEHRKAEELDSIEAAHGRARRAANDNDLDLTGYIRSGDSSTGGQQGPE